MEDVDVTVRSARTGDKPRGVSELRLPLEVKIVLGALSLHPVTQSFHRAVVVRGSDHVQVMESHGSRVMIAHNDTARRAGVENFSVVKLLAVLADAAVVCSAGFYHRS